MYYSLANGLGLVIVGILLYFNFSRNDFQVKRQALNELFIATLAYIMADIPWTYINHDLLPKTVYTQVISSYILAIVGYYLISSWLVYSFTISGKTKFDFKKFWKVVRLVNLGAALALGVVMFVIPDFWVVDGSMRLLFYILVYGPLIITLVFISIYSFIRSFQKTHYARKREYHLNAFGPLVLVVFAVFQIINNDLPVLVYGLIVSMVLIFLSVVLFQNTRDPLTGLNNRNQLNRIITNIGKERPIDDKYILVMIDANCFKSINDKLGHVKGDEVLVLIAKTLVEVSNRYKEKPFLCRYGGDEFVMIFKDTQESEIVDLQDLINDELFGRDVRVPISVSVGHAKWNGDMRDYETCFRMADENMYENKAILKNQ